MKQYKRGDTVRLSDGSVGLIVRVWDDGAMYDIGLLDPDIPAGDDKKRLYDFPATGIKGHVKQKTLWVDVEE